MNKLLKTPEADFDAKKRIGREIDRVAASIQKFRVDSQRFFAGDLPLPPDELREKIVVELRRLRNSSLKGAAANFRLGTLEAQLQSHLDLYGRRLRQKELGGQRRVTSEKSESLNPTRGVIVGAENTSAAVEALYKGLYQHENRMDIEKFRSYIHRQAEAIRTKTGCSEIQFRIAVQDGKTKLKAKPIRTE